MSKLKSCPFCGGNVKLNGGNENWKPTFYDPDSGGDPYHISCKCGVDFCIGCEDAKDIIKAWNTRKSAEQMTQGDKLRKIFGEHVTDDMMINHNRVRCNECVLQKYCDDNSYKKTGCKYTCQEMWQMFLKSEVK